MVLLTQKILLCCSKLFFNVRFQKTDSWTTPWYSVNVYKFQMVLFIESKTVTDFWLYEERPITAEIIWKVWIVA